MTARPALRLGRVAAEIAADLRFELAELAPGEHRGRIGAFARAGFDLVRAALLCFALAPPSPLPRFAHRYVAPGLGAATLTLVFSLALATLTAPRPVAVAHACAVRTQPAFEEILPRRPSLDGNHPVDCIDHRGAPVPEPSVARGRMD